MGAPTSLGSKVRIRIWGWAWDEASSVEGNGIILSPTVGTQFGFGEGVEGVLIEQVRDEVFRLVACD
jgi:hypothetical protein